MIMWLAGGALCILLLASIVRGAPYVPTLRRQIHTALDLLDLEPGKLLIELGSGDGRVVLAAAQRNLRVEGYEINPLLYLISRWRCRRYGKQAHLHCQDMWTADLSAVDGVFVFGVERIMGRLEQKLARELRPGARVASFALELPGRKPVKATHGIFVYQF